MDRHFSKADITLRGSVWGNRGEASAAINVKCYDFGRDAPNRDPIAAVVADFGCSEATAERALEIAWECAVEDFWSYLAPEAANEVLAPAFGLGLTNPDQPEDGPLDCYSDGRSGGWLEVDGKQQNGRINYHLPHVDEWNAIHVSAWGRFEKRIAAEIAWLASYENIRETIDANEWAEPEPAKVQAVAALAHERAS